MTSEDTSSNGNGIAKKMKAVLVLSNGEQIQADTVIQATGWTMSMPYLPQSLQENLVDDKEGLFHLHRFAVNPNLPNIGFVGLKLFVLFSSFMWDVCKLVGEIYWWNTCSWGNAIVRRDEGRDRTFVGLEEEGTPRRHGIRRKLCGSFSSLTFWWAFQWYGGNTIVWIHVQLSWCG